MQVAASERPERKANHGQDEPRPSVNELASDARFARVPKELVRSDLSPKGHKGICVGRDELLRGLNDYFVRQWRESEAGSVRDNDCIAALLTNAPGAGKTTLREEFAFRHAHRGIAVIEVQPSQLADWNLLVEALEEYANQTELREPIRPKESATLMRRAYHLGPEWLTRSLDEPVAAGGVTQAARDGGSSIAPMKRGGITAVQEAIGRFHKELRRVRPDDAEGALQLLDETHEGRFITTVDECHKLANPELRTADLQAHIDLLANPTGRAQINIQGGGLLLAGLASFPDELDGLGLTRAKVQWLDELDGESAEEIVGHYLERTEIPKERRDAITGTWVPALAHAFRHWPQHSATAGLFAQELLGATNEQWQYNPSDPEEHELLQHVITLAARDIRGLYQQRVRNARTAQPTILPEDIAALANLTEDQIPQDALTELLAISMEKKRVAVTNDGLTACLRDLKRAGLCRERIVQHDGRGVEIYSFAMPSLRQHITDNAPPQLMQECTERARRILGGG